MLKGVIQRREMKVIALNVLYCEMVVLKLFGFGTPLTLVISEDPEELLFMWVILIFTMRSFKKYLLNHLKIIMKPLHVNQKYLYEK